MRIAIVLACAALLSGCLLDTTTVTKEEVTINGRPNGGSIGIPVPPPMPRAAAPPPTNPANDPRAPPVTLDGASSFAALAYVRETFHDRGRTVETPACGGAIVATPAGAPDPTHAFGALEYVDSTRLVDAEDRTWVTDRYHDAAQPDNATRTVWVANVRGGEEFVGNGHGACPPFEHEGERFNVLLHADGPDALDLRYLAWERPTPPAARTWASAPAAAG